MNLYVSYTLYHRQSCFRVAGTRQEQLATHRQEGPAAAPDVLPGGGEGDDGEQGGHHCRQVHHGQQQGQVLRLVFRFSVSLSEHDLLYFLRKKLIHAYVICFYHE